jgi:hypothetical protein
MKRCLDLITSEILTPTGSSFGEVLLLNATRMEVSTEKATTAHLMSLSDAAVAVDTLSFFTGK